MRTLTAIAALCLFLTSAAASPPHAQGKPQDKVTWTLVIHGGAGAPTDMTPAQEKNYVATLGLALDAGAAVLAQGGSSLDAVTKSVMVLEDSPLFNAGRGAVFNADGVNEMDAAIMNGADRRAGAVAGVKRVRNPLLAARAVMEKTRHVLLVGDGADSFAEANGLAMEPPHYFFTERRWKAYLEAREKARKGEPPSAGKGTVGAVALDARGDLAAATSTGGLTYKMPGRVGDTPLIGAGTYADKTCAASGTGQGEAFIRSTAARTLCASVATGTTPSAAADRVLADVASLGGDGGLIAIDAAGHTAMRFNTRAMFRAEAKSDGRRTIAIRR